MTVVLILLVALAGILSAWAWAEVARQKKRAKAAETLVVKRDKQIKGMQEAYRHEAKRLEELSRGTGTERFDASIGILRELSRDPNGSD